jgi:hypothetical protein
MKSGRETNGDWGFSLGLNSAGESANETAWGLIPRLKKNPNLLKQIAKDSPTRFSGFETGSLRIDSLAQYRSTPPGDQSPG